LQNVIVFSGSDAVVTVHRNPINEHLKMDTETLVTLAAVQPKGIDFKVTSLLVSGKVKNLKFQEDGTMDGLGSNTV